MRITARRLSLASPVRRKPRARRTEAKEEGGERANLERERRGRREDQTCATGCIKEQSAKGEADSNSGRNHQTARSAVAGGSAGARVRPETGRRSCREQRAMRHAAPRRLQQRARTTRIQLYSPSTRFWFGFGMAPCRPPQKAPAGWSDACLILVEFWRTTPAYAGNIRQAGKTCLCHVCARVSRGLVRVVRTTSSEALTAALHALLNARRQGAASEMRATSPRATLLLRRGCETAACRRLPSPLRRVLRSSRTHLACCHVHRLDARHASRLLLAS